MEDTQTRRSLPIQLKVSLVTPKNADLACDYTYHTTMKHWVRYPNDKPHNLDKRILEHIVYAIEITFTSTQKNTTPYQDINTTTTTTTTIYKSQDQIIIYNKQGHQVGYSNTKGFFGLWQQSHSHIPTLQHPLQPLKQNYNTKLVTLTP